MVPLMSAVLFCKDCRYRSADGMFCDRPRPEQFDLSTGHRHPGFNAPALLCQIERSNDTMCGPDAKYFAAIVVP